MNQKFLSYIVAFFAGLSLWYYPAIDPDLGWHLFGGSYILENGFPQNDPINSFNPFWFDYHWLAQILMYKIYQIGGFDFLRFCFGIIMGLQLVLILDCVRILSKDKISDLVSLFITLFYLLFISNVSSIRPQTIAIFLLTLIFRELIKESKYELLKITLITILLVNIHIFWVFVPFLWLFFRGFSSSINETTKKYNIKYVVGGLFVLLLTPLISPYGFFAPTIVPDIPFGIFGNFVLLLEYLSTPSQFNELVAEFKGGLSSFGTNFSCILGLIILYSVFVSKTDYKKNISYKVLALLGLVLALKAVKFINIASLFCLPLLVIILKDLIIAKRLEKIVISILLLFYISMLALVNPYNQSDQALREEVVPVKLCSHLDVYGSNLVPRADLKRDHIRVLTHFNHGGWCRWALYEKNKSANYKVTTDGRTQFIDPSFFMEGFDLYRLKKEWRKTFEEWAPDMVVAQIDSALAQFMYYTQSEKGWKLANRDETFAVFVRQ